MLSKDAATAELKKHQKPKEWVQGIKPRLDKLPAPSRETARLLAAPPRADDYKRYHKVHEQFNKLSEQQALGVLTMLLPKLQKPIRQTWAMLAELPYQKGYVRKAFRSPGEASLYRPARMAWAWGLLNTIGPYDEEAAWVAKWASHLDPWEGQSVGLLLAGAIAEGGPEAEAVVEALQQQAAGTHEISNFGRHVVTAFLCSPRQDLWEYIEKLLMAAQRQEGLRQAILESIDVSQVGAFRRMLRLILDKDLARFSSVVRAANVWFGLMWDSVSRKQIEGAIEQGLKLLEDDAAREATLAADGKKGVKVDGEAVYFALWAAAVEDASAAAKAADKLLSHAKAEVRYAAVHLLAMLGIPEAERIVQQALADEDLRVAHRAARNVAENATMDEALQHHSGASLPPSRIYQKTFEPMEALLARTPEKRPKPKPILFPWNDPILERSQIADSLVTLRYSRPPARLLVHIDAMSSTGRHRVAHELGKRGNFDAKVRELMLRLIGDPAAMVRGAAEEACKKLKLTPEEAERMEALASRRSEDLRRTVISLLASQNDEAALTSADRLLDRKEGLARLAGLDLLRELHKKDRQTDEVRAKARAYRDRAKELTRDEKVHVEVILQDAAQQVSYDNALGLIDPKELSPVATPTDHGLRFCSEVSIAILKALDEFVHEHREDTVEIVRHDKSKHVAPLGTFQYGFPLLRTADDDEDENSKASAPGDLATTGDAEGSAPPDSDSATANAEDAERAESEAATGAREEPAPADTSTDVEIVRLPLRELWENWWETRPAALREDDGLELLRLRWLIAARVYVWADTPAWKHEYHKRLGLPEMPKLKYKNIVENLIEWLAFLYPTKDLWPTLLSAYETAAARVPLDEVKPKPKQKESSRYVPPWRGEVRSFQLDLRPNNPQWMLKRGVTPDQMARLYAIERFLDCPAAGLGRDRVDTGLLAWAYGCGRASDVDVIDHFIGPHDADQNRYAIHHLGGLHGMTPRRFKEFQKSQPRFAELFMRCVDRVLELELARGEADVVTTPAAMSLQYAGGMHQLLRVLAAMGKDVKLARGHFWGNSAGKGRVFSHLIRATVPAEADTPEAFAAGVAEQQIDPQRLLAIAVYAPQWAKHIEAAVGWAGMEDAVWWIHAHTKDSNWSVEQSLRDAWTSQIRQRTELADADLTEGAVDVAWFGRIERTLGKKRLDELFELAKYAASGTGHRRAQIFADAMRGKLAVKATLDQIAKKRTQDLVRAAGLMPLDKKNVKADLLKRYKAIQEFLRTSRQFGSMRQASEKRAATIGQQNLARTAGYPDPIRLQWAMESESVADLARGPVVVTVKDVAVALAIGDDGLPDVTITRGDKTLSAVPASARKDKAVKALSARKTELRRSASRMRKSLELAMCRGDIFAAEELRDLHANPMLAPMLARLVFVGDGVLGYPVDGGQGLRDHAGKIEPIKKGEALRLAHPHDLLATQKWSQWQRDCFSAERVQPFKQVFRELYVPTPAESKADATRSERYSGHQVNPRQAMALLGSRGWVTMPEEGVFRTFPEEGLVAWLEFEEAFYTPAEVEGLTVSAVAFARRGEWKRTPLTEVPARLFSEVMRDVDLVVSVAHRGGVDPEASQSTVEMRAALLRETLGLLKVNNVKLQPTAAVIRGKLAEYTVHLGSASTHMMPGGALFIVPVHAQHRGRLFLPFADDDPKTAEVMSKVLLLARDEEIRDPNLLAQIRVRS